MQPAKGAHDARNAIFTGHKCCLVRCREKIVDQRISKIEEYEAEYIPRGGKENYIGGVVGLRAGRFYQECCGRSKRRTGYAADNGDSAHSWF